ncbi:hypothetical protein BKA63DRAFT_591783 [Paraphoma chrysanthemicola]|nr:hypothetical protein BKA63DRAFT_591783 [Paraphoma chrysanthemicola]
MARFPSSETSATSGSAKRWISVKQGGKLVLKKALFGLPNEWREGEPLRSTRPISHEVASPSLYKDLLNCHDWIEWAEERMQALWKSLVDADVAREATLQDTNTRIGELQRDHTIDFQIAPQDQITSRAENDAQSQRDIAEKAVALDIREKELQAEQARFEQMKAESTTYDTLCKEVQRFGETINGAVREMESLSDGKGRPEAAYKRWEGTYCTADVKSTLQKLGKQYRLEEEAARAEHLERLTAVSQLEAELNDLAAQKEAEVAVLKDKQFKLEEAQKKFTTKAQHLRSQLGRELSAKQEKVALEAWFNHEIGNLKPAMLADAKRFVEGELKREWDLKSPPLLAAMKEEGRKLGYNAGKIDGRTQGRQEVIESAEEDAEKRLSLCIRENKEAIHSEGYRQGREVAFGAGWDAGLEYGHTKGVREGRDQGYEAGKECGDAEGYEHGWTEGYEAGKDEGDAEAYQRGHAEGDSEGHERGYAAGRAAGHSQGHQKGRAKGYDAGLEDGRREERNLAEERFDREYDAGYDKGHNKGYNKGYDHGYEDGDRDGYNKGRDNGYRDGRRGRR